MTAISAPGRRGVLRTLLSSLVVAVLLAACGGAPGAPGATRAPQVRSENPIPGQNPTGGVNEARWRDTDPVILISFDGFRWDYVDRFQPPAFLRVAAEGVWADGSVAPFPSKTFPSHYSIATGLWAENHELVGNAFVDPVRNAEYALGDREAVEDGSWYAGEPIWVTAETQGMVAASYFFVGSEADVQGVRPSHWRRYDGAISGEAKVDQVLEWLRMPAATRPRMITLYFSDVDGAGHRYGPDSPEVREAVARVDGYLQRLLDGLDAIEGGDRTTLLLVSDHGMYRNDPDRAWPVDLSGMDGVRWVEGGPYAAFLVEGDAARRAEVRDAIDAQLPDEAEVFLREDVPDSLHYSATRKVGDIVVVAPLGANVIEAGRNAPTGYTHGWNPWVREMHGIFLGRGPRLEPGTRLGTVRHVDVYPLMAELLGLEPAEVDGDLSTWTPVLR